MEKIELRDIDISHLSKFRNQGTKSTMYENGDICIKILDGLYQNERNTIYKKLLEMDGLVLDDVLLPKSLIVENGLLVGYTMENFKDSISILDYFLKTRFVNCKEFLSVMKKCSLILRKIHVNDIVCQDLSFDNILIDSQGNIKYSDIDSCSYKDYSSPYMSDLLKRFVIDYRKDKLCYVSKNMDRISFMLSFYIIVYLKELQKLSKRKYHALSDNIQTLENCREYANALLSERTLPEIPYIDELIDDRDDYIIDRRKQLGLFQKLFGR